MSLIVLVAPPLSIRFSASTEKMFPFDRWAVKTTFCRQTYAHTLFSTVNSDVQLLEEEEEEEISDWKETLSWLSLTSLFLDLRQRYVDPRDWG